MLISRLPQTNFNAHKKQQAQEAVPQLHLRPQLQADTVSFGAKIPKYDKTFFMDAISRGYDSAESSLISAAKEFHRALKKVVNKLKAYGFEYDEAYNTKCPLKKKDSVLDKYERQGCAQDMIRGTIYWQDQQDVLAFKKFLDAMKEEGWSISRVRKIDPKTGNFIKGISFPDLEIRQEGLTTESLAPLGEFIQRAEISKPRESTYADWQVRFVSPKDKDHECEVIFLYGPHYKDAKELEHKFVYEPIRKLKKLHVDRNIEHHQKGSPGYVIASNFHEIQKRLIQFISQPLFTNAFNADLKIKDAEKLPVEISKSYAALIMNYAKGISKVLPSYYSQVTKELLKEEQIVSSIKASPSYQIRPDKTISKREIIETRKEVKDRLAHCKERDTTKIAEVINDLKQTIDRFVIKD